MRSLQFQLKGSWSASGDPNARIPWTKQIAEDLAWWTNPSNLAQGVPLSTPPPEVLLYTDASKEGWGAHFQDLTASGIWSKDESSLHINMLEMKAVLMACHAFQNRLMGQMVHSRTSECSGGSTKSSTPPSSVLC